MTISKGGLKIGQNGSYSWEAKVSLLINIKNIITTLMIILVKNIITIPMQKRSRFHKKDVFPGGPVIFPHQRLSIENMVRAGEPLHDCTFSWF